MEFYQSMLIMLSPWLIFLVLALIAKYLITSARKRSATAVAFGALSQIVLPDPQVEKTIEIVAEAKRTIKESKENEEPEEQLKIT